MFEFVRARACACVRVHSCSFWVHLKNILEKLIIY